MRRFVTRVKRFKIRDPVCQVYFSKYLGFRGRLDGYPRFRELLSEVGSNKFRAGA